MHHRHFYSVFSFFSLGLVVTNIQSMPMGHVCLGRIWINVLEQKAQKLELGVSWLSVGFTWPLEQCSCPLQNADRAGQGSAMGPRADLLLNLLTKALLKVCQSSATAMKDLLLSQDPQTGQTTSDHLLLHWVCDATELQHIHNTSKEKLSCLRRALCFWLNLPEHSLCLLPSSPIPFSELGTTICVTFPQQQQSEMPFLGQDSP